MSLNKFQCKGFHTHVPGCRDFYRQRPSRCSLDPLKSQTSHKTNEGRLKEKIAVTDKILQRYRQAEMSETQRLVPALEKMGRDEKSCFGTVGVLLGKYASFNRWGALSKKCSYIFEAILRHKAEVAKLKQEIAIKELEQQISTIDKQTKLVHGEGDHLIDYACTSYAEMVVTIEEIQNFQKLLQYAFDWEHAQLMKQQDEFERKAHRRIMESEAGIKTGIHKDMFSMMDPKILKMKEHNKAMRVIVKEYKDQLAQKREAVKTISGNVKKLENDPDIDARKKLFPEMFFNRADCTPDMELKLDIPIKKYIPI